MTRDASFSFPSSGAGGTALPPATIAPPGGGPGGPRQEGLNLNLGPVSLNVGGGAGSTLEAGVDAARDGLMGLFSKVRNGVDGVRLV